ncbi:MAG: hypothetical protein ABL892_13735 [Thiobacillaceae bacterium]
MTILIIVGSGYALQWLKLTRFCPVFKAFGAMVNCLFLNDAGGFHGQMAFKDFAVSMETNASKP